MTATQTNWIEEALAHADDEPIFADLESLNARRDKLAAKRKTVLPIEGHLLEKIDEDLAALDAEIAQETEFQRQQSNKKELAGYKRIHLDIPLSWRHEEIVSNRWSRAKIALPRLVVYPINSPTMRFRVGKAWTERGDAFPVTVFMVSIVSLFFLLGGLVEGFGGGNWLVLKILVPSSALAFGALFTMDRLAKKKAVSLSPKLPKSLAKHYDDVLTGNQIQDYKFDRTSYFVGSIPEETRAKIAEAKETFGAKNIFIVAEATNWHNNDRVIRNPDPIVIGLRGGTTYMIDAFDLVPIEQAVVSEFTD